MKYINIYNSLKNDIKSGKYAPNSKIPSALELRSMFKASLRTIQHSLNLLEKEGLVKGIRSQGIFVRDSIQMPVYGNIKSDKINKVGILYPRYAMHTIRNPYFFHIFYKIQETLRKHNIRCYLMEIKDKTIPEVFKEINALEINGLICFELENETLQKELEQLKLPLVHLELINFKTSMPIIAANHFQGGELSAQHLFKLGHRKILFLYARKKDDPELEPTNRLRWQGIQSEARKNKITITRAYVLHQLSLEDLQASLKRVLDQYEEYSGIIMTTDYMLRVLKPVVEDRTHRRNRHIDLVSFDEEKSITDIRGKPVHFCVWDTGLMGTKAAETLLAWKDNPPRRQFLPMYLTTLP